MSLRASAHTGVAISWIVGSREGGIWGIMELSPSSLHQVTVHRTLGRHRILRPQLTIIKNEYAVWGGETKEGFGESRSCPRRAGDKQRSTGVLHFTFKSPFGIK